MSQATKHNDKKICSTKLTCVHLPIIRLHTASKRERNMDREINRLIIRLGATNELNNKLVKNEIYVIFII